MSISYIVVPTTVDLNDLEREGSLSPSNYSKLNIKNKNLVPLKKLIKHPLRGGKEIGSKEYIKTSNKFFIRTRAITEDNLLLDYNSEGITPIRPQAFNKSNLKEGDILISKDSNVGEVVILEKDLPNYALSGGIRILEIEKNRHYVFAFLKSSFFKNQLHLLISRGATIKHAKTKFLDCFIPFPNGKSKDSVIEYVSLLMRAMIRKEVKIREMDKKINQVIYDELLTNQKKVKFSYEFPSLDEVISSKRIDTGLYSSEFKEKTFLINNYKYGANNLKDWGFEPSRGQNLQVSAIGTSLYSEEPRSNWYKLFLPKHLSSFGTVSRIIYLGNKNKLRCLEKGDIIFGAEGFEKGRSILITTKLDRTITNIHGITFKSKEHDLIKSAFIRCFVNYLRNQGLVDRYAVGGNGGSLAQKYWDVIKFPVFPRQKQEEIANLYNNPMNTSNEKFTLGTFENKDIAITNKVGILQLDKQIKIIRNKIDLLMHQIVDDSQVKIDFSFYQNNYV